MSSTLFCSVSLFLLPVTCNSLLNCSWRIFYKTFLFNIWLSIPYYFPLFLIFSSLFNLFSLITVYFFPPFPRYSYLFCSVSTLFSFFSRVPTFLHLVPYSSLWPLLFPVTYTFSTSLWPFCTQAFCHTVLGRCRRRTAGHRRMLGDSGAAHETAGLWAWPVNLVLHLNFLVMSLSTSLPHCQHGRREGRKLSCLYYSGSETSSDFMGEENTCCFWILQCRRAWFTSGFGRNSHSGHGKETDPGLCLNGGGIQRPHLSSLY